MTPEYNSGGTTTDPDQDSNTSIGDIPEGGLLTKPTNISPYQQAQNNVRSALRLGLFTVHDVEKKAWIDDITNALELMAMDSYLEYHKNEDGSYSQDDLDFAELAIKALIDDGKVDFPNKVIELVI